MHGLAYPVGFGRLAVCGDQGTVTGCRIDLRQTCGIYLDALVSGSSA